jgi:hypothetical protein
MAHQCGSERQLHWWDYITPVVRNKQIRGCVICMFEEVVSVCRDGVPCSDCRGGCLVDDIATHCFHSCHGCW